MTSVLLIEDDTRIRAAVRAMLANAPRYSLLGEAGSLAEATLQLRASTPEIILLDLGLPDGPGTHILEALSGEKARPMVLVLTVFDDDEHIFDALRGGAVGYLLKEDVGARLLPSLDELGCGGSPMSPSIARRVLTSFAAVAPAGDAPPLTTREREVTERLAYGSTYDQVAVELGISKNTVRTYIRSIYDKLQVCSKTEAVREAMRLGIVKRP